MIISCLEKQDRSVLFKLADPVMAQGLVCKPNSMNLKPRGRWSVFFGGGVGLFTMVWSKIYINSNAACEHALLPCSGTGKLALQSPPCFRIRVLLEVRGPRGRSALRRLGALPQSAG